MIDPLRVERARPADEAMHLILLVDLELGHPPEGNTFKGQ